MNFNLLYTLIVCFLVDNIKSSTLKCTDTRGFKNPNGSIFIPITNNCIECTCIDSEPAHCHDLDCSVPITYECEKYGYGHSCCLFDCRDEDDVLNFPEYITDVYEHSPVFNYFKALKNTIIKTFKDLFNNN